MAAPVARILERPGRKALGLLGVAAIYLVVEALTSVRISTTVPDGVTGSAALWPAYVEHHTVQLLLGLATVMVLSRGRPASFGLRRGDLTAARQLLLRGFLPLLLLGLLAGHTAVPLLQGAPPGRFADGLPAVPDLLGMLFFAAVLVGISEEVLFRGVFHTLLAREWRGTVTLLGVRLPVAGLLSSALFTIAHVHFTPEGVTADPRQLVLAFVMGLYYAVAYERTGSLLVPVVAHNAVDGGILLAELGVTAFLT